MVDVALSGSVWFLIILTFCFFLTFTHLYSRVEVRHCSVLRKLGGTSRNGENVPIPLSGVMTLFRLPLSRVWMGVWGMLVSLLPDLQSARHVIAGLFDGLMRRRELLERLVCRRRVRLCRASSHHGYCSTLRTFQLFRGIRSRTHRIRIGILSSPSSPTY